MNDLKKVKVTCCEGEGQGSCKRCVDKGIWNRMWMSFLYKIEGLEGCYCAKCVDEIMEEIEMREILFRGKRIDNREWIYGGIDSDWAMPYEKRKRYWIIPPFHDGVMVDPETVGQYTGINDKDGKKIFEGDIIKYPLYHVPDGDGVVRWDRGHWISECFFRPYERDLYDAIYRSDVYIIGNKYDNKELLKYYTTVLEVGETEDGRLRITEFTKPEDCHFPRMTEVKE